MRIALYQGKSLVSRLIRWQTRSVYSHAAFLLDEGSVIEAWTPCCREVRPEFGMQSAECGINRRLAALSKQHTPGTRVDIFNFVCPLTREENLRLEWLARRDVGTPYDYRSIVRFLTRERSSQGRHRLFCSEQVFARCEQIGRALLERTEAWRVPPDWLARSPLLYLDETIVTL